MSDDGHPAPEDRTGSGWSPSDVVRSLLVNALRDVVTGSAVVLADETSRGSVTQAYEQGTDPSERSAFERAIAQADTEDGPGTSADDIRESIDPVVEGVARFLRETGVELTVEHTSHVSLPAREVALHEFALSRDPSRLALLSVSEPIRAAVDRGAQAVATGDFNAADRAFEDAIDAARTIDDDVAARTLGAWSAHWNGDDGRAIDLVEEALHLQMDTWAPRQVGLAAGHSSPELFREGTLSARCYLRTRTASEAGTIEAAIGVDDGEGDLSWHDLVEATGCYILPSLAPESHVRLRLRGTVDAFPALQAYYLAVGIVDENLGVPRNVEEILLQGPRNDTARETLRVGSP
jgi:hypothetical protein